MNVVAIAFIPCNFQDKVPKQFFSKYLESSLEILYLLILSTENKKSVFLSNNTTNFVNSIKLMYMCANHLVSKCVRFLHFGNANTIFFL